MIAVVVGTRPEIIKMAPVMRQLKDRKIPFIFLHSNQHYSKELDADIISDLKLDKPSLNLNVGSGSHAVQTARAMEAIESFLSSTKVSLLLVHGDTNTALAGALAAKKMNVAVGHVEAGLRCGDLTMPEEINRLIIDRISDYHFCPTKNSVDNLLHEGISGERVHMTGNTVVDALHQHQKYLNVEEVMSRFNVSPGKFILSTTHRPENVDSEENLRETMMLLQHAATKTGFSVLLPLHPRTQSNINKFKIDVGRTIKITPPIGYIDMLALMSESAFIMTDSGGLQEEAYVLNRPVFTMRPSTERPETLSANRIISRSCKLFDLAYQELLSGDFSWGNELGNGDASKKIIRAIEDII